jgi:hypothetical protein
MRATGRRTRLRMHPPLWVSRCGLHRFLPDLDEVISNYVPRLKVKLILGLCLSYRQQVLAVAPFDVEAACLGQAWRARC